MRRVINRLPLAIVLVVTGLFAFSATAFAANTIDPNSNTLDIAKAVYDAFSGGHYAYAAAIGVILVVALVKRYLVPREHWLQSETWQLVLMLVGADAAAMAAGLAGGGPVSWSLIWSSFLVGVGAAGGFAVLEKLLAPVLTKIQGKLPAWAQPILSLVLWVFDHGQAAEQAQVEAKAVAAGDAAVAAKPAQGAAAVTGPAVELK